MHEQSEPDIWWTCAVEDLLDRMTATRLTLCRIKHQYQTIIFRDLRERNSADTKLLMHEQLEVKNAH